MHTHFTVFYEGACGGCFICLICVYERTQKKRCAVGLEGEKKGVGGANGKTFPAKIDHINEMTIIRTFFNNNAMK